MTAAAAATAIITPPPNRTHARATATGHTPAASNMSLEFCEASAEALPFDAATFDAVTIAFGLRNVRHVTHAATCDM